MLAEYKQTKHIWKIQRIDFGTDYFQCLHSKSKYILTELTVWNRLFVRESNNDSAMIPCSHSEVQDEECVKQNAVFLILVFEGSAI